MENLKVLSKLFQLIGALIAIAGLTGENRLLAIDKKIIYLIGRINPKPLLSKLPLYSRKILSFWSGMVKALLDYLSEKSSKYFMVPLGLISVVLLGIYIYFFPSVVLSKLGSSRLAQALFAIEIVVILVSGMVSWVITNEKPPRSKRNKIKIIGSFLLNLILFSFFLLGGEIALILLIISAPFVYMTEGLVHASIWIVGLALVILFYIVGFCFVVALAIVKVMLIPYEILDWIAAKWKLQSTLLLAGSLLTVLGILLDQ